VSWSIIIALGAVGAVLRGLITHRWSPLVGTLIVNVGASFVLGLTAAWEGAAGAGVRIGLLGALSTWSSFAHQLAELIRTGRGRRAAAYLAVTMIAGVGAAWIGLTIS
jgi:CrcB protein